MSPTGRIVAGALALVAACGSDKAPPSDHDSVDSSRLGFSLLYTHRVTAEKLEEVKSDVVMKAEVRRLPEPDAEGNSFVGGGSYRGKFISHKVNCENNLPMDYETIEFANKAKATASADDMGSGQTSVVFTITPIDPPKAHLLTTSFRGLEQAGGVKEEDLPDLILPVLGNVVLAGDSGQATRTFEMYGGSCSGMLTHVTTWTVKRSAPPCAKAPPLGEDLARERDALVKGMQDAGFPVGPEHVSVESKEMSHFQVRLGEDGCILLSIEAIKAGCPPDGKQKGAKRLLIGTVQHAGTTTRVTARIVEAETSVILKAAKADADGNGTDATTAAMNEALKQLKLEGCVE